MELKLFLLICFVIVIAVFIELSYFKFNGRKVGLISRLILSLLFPIILVFGFILGSIFLFLIIGIVLLVLVLVFISYLKKKFFRRNDSIILIKRKK